MAKLIMNMVFKIQGLHPYSDDYGYVQSIFRSGAISVVIGNEMDIWTAVYRWHTECVEVCGSRSEAASLSRVLNKLDE